MGRRSGGCRVTEQRLNEIRRVVEREMPGLARFTGLGYAVSDLLEAVDRLREDAARGGR